VPPTRQLSPEDPIIFMCFDWRRVDFYNFGVFPQLVFVRISPGSSFQAVQLIYDFFHSVSTVSLSSCEFFGRQSYDLQFLSNISISDRKPLLTGPFQMAVHFKKKAVVGMWPFI